MFIRASLGIQQVPDGYLLFCDKTFMIIFYTEEKSQNKVVEILRWYKKETQIRLLLRCTYIYIFDQDFTFYDVFDL